MLNNRVGPWKSNNRTGKGVSELETKGLACSHVDPVSATEHFVIEHVLLPRGSGWSKSHVSFLTDCSATGQPDHSISLDEH